MPVKYSIAQAEKAILKNFGNITAASKTLGVSHASLFYTLKKSKRLQEARVQAQETTLDIAEHSLLKAVKDGKPWAVCFFLKCQGKKRGWIENPLQVPPSTDENETYNVEVTVRAKVE